MLCLNEPWSYTENHHIYKNVLLRDFSRNKQRKEKGNSFGFACLLIRMTLLYLETMLVKSKPEVQRFPTMCRFFSISRNQWFSLSNDPTSSLSLSRFFLFLALTRLYKSCYIYINDDQERVNFGIHNMGRNTAGSIVLWLHQLVRWY